MIETLIGWAIGIILVPVLIFLAAVGVDAWENRGRERSLRDLGESLDRAKELALGERPMLFNLDHDLAESNDLATTHHNRAKRMFAALSRWRDDVASGATPQ